MHIKKYDPENSIDFVAWCGVTVSGLSRAYLSIDNALKAIHYKRGTYPCHKCLREIQKTISDALPENEA